MTLILTHINKYGIILASDSNLTNNEGNTGFGQKVFPIPHLNSALTYSGNYSINGKSIDLWMTNFITGSFFTCKTIEQFTSELSNRMTSEMRDEEINAVSIVHVCGYQVYNNISYLEHWHISNGTLSNDGNYSKAINQFHFCNDFNTRTVDQHREILNKLNEDSTYHQFYINGFPPGRMGIMHIKQVMDKALKEIWNHEEWGFRKPQNIFEVASTLEFYFELVALLFKMSNYNALYIGGKTQLHIIPVPQNINTF